MSISVTEGIGGASIAKIESIGGEGISGGQVITPDDPPQWSPIPDIQLEAGVTMTDFDFSDYVSSDPSAPITSYAIDWNSFNHQGLTFNTTTGVLSGTPMMAIQRILSLGVTATNTNGDTDTTFNINYQNKIGVRMLTPTGRASFPFGQLTSLIAVEADFTVSAAPSPSASNTDVVMFSNGGTTPNRFIIVRTNNAGTLWTHLVIFDQTSTISQPLITDIPIGTRVQLQVTEISSSQIQAVIVSPNEGSQTLNFAKGYDAGFAWHSTVDADEAFSGVLFGAAKYEVLNTDGGLQWPIIAGSGDTGTEAVVGSANMVWSGTENTDFEWVTETVLTDDGETLTHNGQPLVVIE